jgi:hypothetical protein
MESGLGLTHSLVVQKFSGLKDVALLKSYLETFEIYRSSARAIANTSQILVPRPQPPSS